MGEWFYKATNKKLDKAGTMLLAGRGFLCRSAYNSKDHWIPNVQSVHFGDILHFYFIGKKAFALGAFEIIRREDFKIGKPIPSADSFRGPVTGCSLYEVEDPSFITQLDPDGGYKVDPKIDKYTGWLLRRVGSAAPAPAKFLSETPTLIARSFDRVGPENGDE